MALTGKTVVVIEIKSNGNVFFNALTNDTENIRSFSPTTIQELTLLSDGYPDMLRWKFFHDGKTIELVTISDVVDEEKDIGGFEMYDGDLVSLYKTLDIKLHVEKNDTNSWNVTWTFEYEKKNADVPDPDALVEIFKKITKDIEAHYLQTNKETNEETNAETDSE